MIPYKIDRATLRSDLMQAYLDARRHKRSRRYQLDFEADLEHNLDKLCNELYTRTYKPLPSDCFIITDPKKREVFAAAFRDRIVHHLYYKISYNSALFQISALLPLTLSPAPANGNLVHKRISYLCRLDWANG